MTKELVITHAERARLAAEIKQQVDTSLATHRVQLDIKLRELSGKLDKLMVELKAVKGKLG